MTRSRDARVGIALSGGGIRAAAFGLGALQALQEQRQLVRGPRAARWISGVSGGGYAASAATLLNAGSRARYVGGAPVGGSDLPPGVGPFGPGSPELDHVLRHSGYIAESGGVRLGLVFVGLLLAQLGIIGARLIALMMLLAAAAVANAAVATAVLGRPTILGVDTDPGDAILAVVALAANVWIVFFADFPHGIRLRAVRGGVGAAVIVVALLTAPSLIATLRLLPILASPGWLTGPHWALLGIIAGSVAIGVVLLMVIGRIRPLAVLHSAGSFVLNLVLTWLPAAIAIVLLSWGAVAVVDLVVWSPDTGWHRALRVLVLGGLIAVTVLSLVFDRVPGGVSLHVPYRRYLARCFAVVVRWKGGEPAVAVPVPSDRIAISSLRSPEHGIRWPDLVLGASANLSDRGVAPAGTHTLSVAIDSERYTIPARLGASLAIADLEAMRGRRMLGAWTQPTLSLGAAVAISGAALAPEMGQLTQPRFRALMTALNIRLGVWMPNPLVPRARQAVRDRRGGAFAVGFSQLFMEMVGLNPSRANVVYTTDGGHRENLGLVELLRRGCTEIWAVDSSTDPPGAAPSLMQTMLMAETDLGCRIELDLGRFRLDARRRPTHVTAHGWATYANGTRARLHVVRLGVSGANSTAMAEYARVDPPFPFHSTLNQIYPAERFGAYLRLGRESMGVALADE